jgi:hypothetical protein
MREVAREVLFAAIPDYAVPSYDAFVRRLASTIGHERV